MNTASIRISPERPDALPSGQPKPYRKVLIIDESPTDRRKARIAAFRELGIIVYPALNLNQAKSRCKPGRFGLIVAVAAENGEHVLQWCDQLRSSNPKQPMLMLVPAGQPVPPRDYAMAEDMNQLRVRVAALFPASLAPDVAVAA